VDGQTSPSIPPAVERYLDKLATLNAADWGTLAERANARPGGVAGLFEWFRSAEEYRRAIRSGGIPPASRHSVLRRFKTVVAKTQPAPTPGAVKVAHDGLVALLHRGDTAEEFFERAYTGVSKVIPLDTVL
jgi:hypothetical protein